MCVYNADKPSALREAIDSMLLQTHTKTDIFIYIDGEIKADLKLVLDEYDKANNKIHLYYNAINKGLAFGLNSLISEVLNTGKYHFIARMDSDDISYNSRIEEQVLFFRKNPQISVLGTGCLEFGASFALDSKILPARHETLKSFSVSRCPFIHPSVMFRVAVFEEGNRYPTDTALTEDMALWFELLAKGYNFANLDVVLLKYRLNEDTLKRRKGFSKCYSEIKLRFKYMYLLNECSLKNSLLILSRVFFHLAPTPIIALAYKKLR
ncbi:glycosyltransferase [Pseudoalteromonas fuliginea]|uniref:Glycosyltransferase n=2 Tax=Pseudoalteromonas fuliginea TaxID=1872678 RepID=A0AB73BJ38_9GAMM|nr:glycosyltransferase [Pseudoalteromonas fuliginea]